ncbi:MAG: hypothetical protein KGZ74_07125 [Chitinophagaceae bacterium]|nr:hypothetical protein [Chitinophagaceae bacterium]
MEMNNKMFNDFDSSLWEEPHKYALLKEKSKDLGEYYTIYQISPIFMMKLCDDFEYAQALAEKMIAHGVKVYDDFIVLYNLYKNDSSI